MPEQPDTCEYIRRTYRVPAYVGGRVTVSGKQGEIVGGTHVLTVRFDDGTTGYCHPTWRVVYEK